MRRNFLGAGFPRHHSILQTATPPGPAKSAVPGARIRHRNERRPRAGHQRAHPPPSGLQAEKSSKIHR